MEVISITPTVTSALTGAGGFVSQMNDLFALAVPISIGLFAAIRVVNWAKGLI